MKRMLKATVDRPTNATDSVSLMREWLYNNRSELAVATIGMNQYGYEYDTIGNRLWSADNIITNSYSANNLNQYTTVGLATPSAPQTSLFYDTDGNMTRDGAYTYSYDAENRLRTVTSRSMTNGALRVLNAYDHRNRRIRKTVQRLHSTSAPPPAPPLGTDEWLTLETHTFVWDDNNIVLEKVDFADGTTRTFEYFWGMDKSGTEQGAGGVGGLLAVSVDGVFYIPCYDHNGNIILYISETGSIAAQYTYDPYGNIIESSGPLADVFSFGFSTQYHDRETGMVSYKFRFYRPDLGRWLNRDPIEEEGSASLYVFCGNNPQWYYDILGLTKVTIDMKLTEEYAKNIKRDFLNIAVTVLEEPKGKGFLNFIQLKKTAGEKWSLDWDHKLGPYYYSLIELGAYTTFNRKGQRVITLKDAPGGAIGDPTWFYVAVVEIHEQCKRDKTGKYILKCYDKVRVIASRVWKYVPFEEQPFIYQNKEPKLNLSAELKEIVNKSKWGSNLCSNVQVEIQ